CSASACTQTHKLAVLRFREGRLGPHGAVDHHPFEIMSRQRAGLVRHRQALLDQRHKLLLVQPPAPVTSGQTAVCGRRSARHRRMGKATRSPPRSRSDSRAPVPSQRDSAARNRAPVRTKRCRDNADVYVCNLEIMRMPALSPCRPSSTEHVMCEWCERKKGEANVHWHYPTVHFVQKQLIMAG